MVFKHDCTGNGSSVSFENDVKMYGIQTKDVIIMCEIMFENDVKMYGIQTHLQEYQTQLSFENDVN